MYLYNQYKVQRTHLALYIFLRQISCNDDNVISDTQHSDIVVECLVIPLIDTRMYRYEWKYLNTNPDGLLQCQSMYESMYRNMYRSNIQSI